MKKNLLTVMIVKKNLMTVKTMRKIYTFRIYLMNYLSLLMTMTTVRMIQIQKLTLKLKVAAQIRQFSVETQSLDTPDRVKT